MKITKTINNYQEAETLAQKYKKAGKKIVLTQGSFDMLHIGHCRYLTEAKDYGDVLFVGIDSDEKIKKRKGADRPVVPESERVEMLNYIDVVDHVVLKDVNEAKWALIKSIKPDVLIATKETYDETQIKKLEEFCGKVVVLNPMATTSTSAKIRLVQMGGAKKLSNVLSTKLIKTIEDVLEEIKGL